MTVACRTRSMIKGLQQEKYINSIEKCARIKTLLTSQEQEIALE